MSTGELWWALAVPGALLVDWMLDGGWRTIGAVLDEFTRQTCPVCHEDCTGKGVYRTSGACVTNPIRWSRD